MCDIVSRFLGGTEQVTKIKGLKPFKMTYLEIAVVALLVGHGDVELVEGETDSLQILLILHPVNEVPAHNVRLQQRNEAF